MPTTLVGLLIFVVLLLPGFAYLVGKERHGPERRASPFRETVAIVAASIASELFVLVLFGLARLALPNALPDITELIRVPRAYLVGTQGKPGHLVMVGASGLVALAAATALAYAASVTTIRALVCRLSGHILTTRQFRRGGLSLRSGRTLVRSKLAAHSMMGPLLPAF